MIQSITKKLAPLLVGLAISYTGFSQSLSIQGKLDRTEIKTGEQAAIDLIIRTNNLEKTRFYLKESNQSGEAPYTIIEFGAIDTVNIEGNLKEITAKLILTSFDSTLITIPPIVVESPEGTAETAPQALKVTQPQVDSTHPENFRDIKNPWDITLSLTDWLEVIFTSWILWCLISVLIIGYIIYKWITRKKTIEAPILSVEPLSLIERIRNQLTLLEEKHLPEQELFKEFYSELVSIIKDYLDNSRAWNTLEMTSSQLLEKCQTEKISRDKISILKNILSEADLSKFAKSNPTIESTNDSLKATITIIEQLEIEIRNIEIRETE